MSGQTPYYVATAHGILELAPDGTRLRAMSSTPAQWARRSPSGDNLIYLNTAQNEVRSLSLQTCEDRRVGRIRDDLGRNCGGMMGQDVRPLDRIESPSDVALTADGSALCLRIRDRNENMSSVAIDVHVSLGDGTTTEHVRFSETCGSTSDSVLATLPCSTALTSPPHGLPGPVASNFRYGLRGRTLVDRNRAVATFSADVLVDATSPSGRWQVLSTDIEEGDYIYRRLFLFDRASGHVIPIRNGAAPSPLTLAELRRTRDVDTHVAVGETEIRYTGNGEQVVIDDMLIDPGVRVLALPGSLAH